MVLRAECEAYNCSNRTNNVSVGITKPLSMGLLESSLKQLLNLKQLGKG